MKRFFIHIFIFFALLFCLDKGFGYAFEYLQSHAVGGDTGRNNYICNETDEEVLVFGSSRAIHHYDSRIIEDSLGMSCYNCGNDGNGIVLLYGRYRMIAERYTPKVILYDVCTSFDLLAGDNHRYLDWLRPYYHREGIDSIFISVDRNERYKMLSSMYQYNSKILQLVSDNVAPMQEDIKGYRPIRKTMPYEPEAAEENHVYEYDSLKLHYLEQLIKECQGKTRLIFFASPLYHASDAVVYEPLKKLCEKYDVPFWNYYTDGEFVNTKDYFSDTSHLNETGATAYTKRIVGRIKTLLNGSLQE